MAHFKKAFPSKYLQAADLDVPIIATIKNYVTENVGSGEDAKSKPVVRFVEDVKPVVLSLTRGEAIAAVAGNEDTDGWPGVRIQLVRGMTIYKGKPTPCIVIQAPPATLNPRAF